MSGNQDDFSGEIPRNYDRYLGPVLFAGYAMDMARRAAASDETLARVLETAAGTGFVTRALRDVLPPSVHLTATDLNPAMLDIARTKFRADDDVAFQPADAMSLPFPDGSFDTMVCQFGVMFFPDKEKGHREAHRVLMRGGRYVFSVWDSHRHNAFGRIVHEEIGGFFPVDPPLFYAVPFGYHQIDPIKQALLAAGFGEIDITVCQADRPVADFWAFARGIVYGNPVFDQIRQRGGASPSQVQDAVATAMRLEFGREPCVIPTQAIAFEARRE